MGDMIERMVSNAVIVGFAGQIPPFTALPEEVVSIPAAVLLAAVGVDLNKTISKILR